MELVSPLIASHQQRTAFIAWRICKAAKLSSETTEMVFVAALLHDVGAITPEEKIDIHSFAYEVEHVMVHCRRGEVLLGRVPWLAPAARIVRFHHREWQEWDKPLDVPYVLESQILFLADFLERSINRNQYILHQNQQLISEISALSGTAIHPQVVDYFLAISHREDFWLDMMSPRLFSLLLHNGPYKKLEIDLVGIVIIAQLFRNIIDFRCRYTATHSSGVAECAAILAQKFGLTETETKLIEIAGNLHDIGKLVVPSAILNKNGELSASDFAVIKQHSYQTLTILNTIGGLQPLAEWAASHHERLDGSGYPFHYSAERLSTPARIIIVADIFTALAEDRPYRKGFAKEQLVAELKRQADEKLLDQKIVNLLLKDYDEIAALVTAKQADTKDYYDRQFACLAWKDNRSL